jgi:lipopolysaccharide/colanic/teichoic acid biosynthesis glycosyltransferase
VEIIVSKRHLQDAATLTSLRSAGVSADEKVILNDQAFRRMIALERKRSERSRKPFVLMLFDVGKSPRSENDSKLLGGILNQLSRSIRETDTAGWYQDSLAAGIMFTEISREDQNACLDTLIARVTEELRSGLTCEEFDRISLSVHVFPEDWEPSDGQRPNNPKLYPDLAEREQSQSLARIIKRAIDITGSVAAIVVLAPIFLVIAIAIKASSRGPVFYRQPRIGQHGILFSLLKFRSMYDGNNSSVHREYMGQLIAGVAEKHPSHGERKVYKLTRDSRITAVGAFLRRTSLDELPQFFNVLKGEMSLVGPRPPLDYEVERYELWHRRRLTDAKPGITGLWQVSGRNRIAFDDMVRLDLRYAQSWSLWVDLKILLRTPKAVIEGAH